MALRQSCYLFVLLFTISSVIGGDEKNISPRKMESTTQRKPVAFFDEEAEDDSAFEARNGPVPSLMINPVDRQKLRETLLDTMRRRRVTAIMPTMSPSALSTPNVYNFFSRKRFSRVQTTTTEPTLILTKSEPIVGRKEPLLPKRDLIKKDPSILKKEVTVPRTESTPTKTEPTTVKTEPTMNKSEPILGNISAPSDKKIIHRTGLA